MSTDAPDFATLLERFEMLGRRDRKAVLAQLSPQDQQLVSAAIANETAARRQEAERVARAGRQFAGYSPWLSDIVQQACTDGAKLGTGISDTARRALSDVHRAIHEEDGGPPQNLFGHLRRRIGDLIKSPGQETR